MEIFEQLNNLAIFMGVTDSYKLSELLIKGICPNGQTIDEKEQKRLIARICHLLYITADDIKRIKDLIGNV